MEATMDETRTRQSAPEPALTLSRRRLLVGAAAGALSYPLLGARSAAAVPTRRALGAESLVPEPAGGPVSGRWHPRFRRVRDEFVRNFAERGEVGAAACAIVDGHVAFDLWGGTARVDTAQPWEEDTLVHVWSCTKGATALCAHILASRGLLDLDAPVVDYWPEFGQNGKQGVTVAMLLSHQAGVPALRDPLPPGAFYDVEQMVDRLAAEALFWEPGTRHGYHALTFGFLVGELVRRISGRTLGGFFEDEVAGPLGIDFSMGLPDSELSRLAAVIPADPPTPPFSNFLLAALTDPTSVAALVLFNNGGYLLPGEAESAQARAATEIGASGGFTNARGLARLYAALAGDRRPGGTPLVDAASLVRMVRTHSAGSVDAMGLIPSRFTLGYVKSIDNRRQSPGNQDTGILSEDAFGHSGFGGSIGFVDPRARLSFGYVMNRQGQGTLLNPRGQSLIDETYRALGYREQGGNFVQV
jgi:CubicO group peptidase (beta-lactamase class C family)